MEDSVQSYKLQLQQVEAALISEPGNEDLLKLQKDLQEVLALTQDLIRTQGANENSRAKPGTSTADKAAAAAAAAEPQWKIGDHCMAPFQATGQMAEAQLLLFHGEEVCTVVFMGQDDTEIVPVSSLKPLEAAKKSKVISLPVFTDSDRKVKKQMLKVQREQKKKKQQKKLQRLKVMEDEREKEKSKWRDFNSKAFSKNKKGHVKKSIFATPDNVNGRVGVGTCGIGGKPMTDYQHQEKWKKT